MPRDRQRHPYLLFPIELPLHYQLDHPNHIDGTGRTVAISSQVVKFECDDFLQPHEAIRLRLAWPVALPNGASLNLWIAGRVIRSVRGEAQVALSSYEFRTRPPGPSDRLRWRRPDSTPASPWPSMAPVND